MSAELDDDSPPPRPIPENLTREEVDRILRCWDDAREHAEQEVPACSAV